ncbi:hypothetical protein [Niallia sp. MER TA 168]|uniref:hypothetical protein n=1 Tax=Niallia sp. MER TA 168 TaxID=2939568 RepID=UPI00203D5C36|nr:hypothetical protein [Niallia sp. MER TA 168]MCM3360360.1 hypothetical protein [Niallia sp. MER TA 168]
MSKVIIQCILILSPLLVGIFYPLQKIVYGFLSLLTIDTTNIDIAIKSITSNEKIISIICGIILSVFFYFWIKRANTEKLFNTGNGYNDYPLVIYWIAGKILGYGKVTLVRVPIYLQYKLLLAHIFPNIQVDSDVENKEKDVNVIEKNMEQPFDELNLILMDTYEITEDQIPLNKINLPTVIIQNGNDFGGHRFFNPEFVKMIREKTNLYSRTFMKVNIYSTTNTNHNEAIITKCFKNGNRTGFKNITVYQANREDYSFTEEHKVL